MESGDVDSLSLDDILQNPKLLKGDRFADVYATPDELEDVIRQAQAAGWRRERLGRGRHKGQGLMLREVKGGNITGRTAEWHPGGGHHGPYPYWKISSGERGIVRVGPQFPDP